MVSGHGVNVIIHGILPPPNQQRHTNLPEYQFNPNKIFLVVINQGMHLKIASVSTSLFILFLPVDWQSDGRNLRGKVEGGGGI